MRISCGGKVTGEMLLIVTIKSPSRGNHTQLRRTRCVFQCVFPEPTRVRTRYRSLIFVFAPCRAGRPAGRLLQLDKSAFFQGRPSVRRTHAQREKCLRRAYLSPGDMEMRECVISKLQSGCPKPDASLVSGKETERVQ